MKPTDKQLRCIFAKRPGELTNDDFDNLNARQIQRLSPHHIAALAPEQIAKMHVKQVAALTQDQVAVLSLEQLGLVPPARRKRRQPAAVKTAENPKAVIAQKIVFAFFLSLIPAMKVLHWLRII